jgi:hypothetical protein
MGTTKAARAVGVEATSSYFSTPQHIHVGDTTADVLGAYGGMTCHPADAPTPTHPDKYCTRPGPAHRATLFYFGHKGNLDRIVVSVA